MAAIPSHLRQIQNFNSIVIQAPANLEVIESAKEFFQKLLPYSSDPECAKALNTAKTLLDLKEEQAILAAKVKSVLDRWKQLESSVKEANSENYPTLSKEIKELKNDLRNLREDAFPVEIQKEVIAERLQLFERALKQHDPNAWMWQTLAYSVIATGIGLLTAYAPGTEKAVFDMGLNRTVYNYFNTSICNEQPPAACTSISPQFMLGAGLFLGASGLLIAHTIYRVRRAAFPMLIKAYTWATTDKQETLPIQAKEGRPKMFDMAISPLSLSEIPLKPLHPAKQFAYDRLKQKEALAEQLHLTLHRLENLSDALNCKVFQRPSQPVVEKSGPFAFPPSTDTVVHWTADFADSNLLGYIEGGLLAQEELLALEHPVLYHLHALLDQHPSVQPLKGDQIALITHAARLGSLKGLYGNEFANASLETIDAHLKRFDEPVFSNLFAMAAPQNPGVLGEPYQKRHLKELFTKASAAFIAVAERSESAQMQPIVHTGNWGAGAFGGSPLAAALTQLLAARVAGVEVHYYPMNEKEAFLKAQKILANIERQSPNACVGEILVHLATHAKEYGIVYGESNCT